MSPLELCRLMAKTWKDNGGDAMGFHWLHSTIRMEILKLESADGNLALPLQVATPFDSAADSSDTSTCSAEKPDAV